MKLQSLIAEGQTLSDATGRPRSGVQLVRPAKLYSRHDWQPFELKTALVPSAEDPPEPTTATAYPLVWNDDNDELLRDETSDFPVWDLLGIRRGRAYDAEYDVPGARGLARKIGGRWAIMRMEHQARILQFEFKEDLNVYDSTVDVSVDDHFDGYDPAPVTGKLTIYACPGHGFYGKYFAANDTGTHGTAFYDVLNDRYWIVRIEPLAVFIQFTLTETLTTGTASAAATVDANGHYQGRHPDPTGAGLTVWNKTASGGYAFAGDIADKGTATYDEQNKKYRIIQIEPA